MNTMREEFEAWAKSERMNLNYALGMGDAFYSAETKAAWQAWQAARQPVGEAVAWQVKDEDSDWEWAWADKGVYLMVKRHRPHHARELFTTPPQQPERVDLDQFRDAVQGWRESASNDQADGRISLTEWFVIADRADRLLALINQQESKP